MGVVAEAWALGGLPPAPLQKWTDATSVAGPSEAEAEDLVPVPGASPQGAGLPAFLVTFTGSVVYSHAYVDTHVDKTLRLDFQAGSPSFSPGFINEGRAARRVWKRWDLRFPEREVGPWRPAGLAVWAEPASPPWGRDAEPCVWEPPAGPLQETHLLGPRLGRVWVEFTGHLEALSTDSSPCILRHLHFLWDSSQDVG